MIRPMLKLLGIGLFILLPGCACQEGSGERVHGGIGVQAQSRDTSGFDRQRVLIR
jgi:hypothetical protein